MMHSNYSRSTIILIISFIIAIAGLYNDVFFTTHSFDTVVIKQFLNPLNLDAVLMGESTHLNGHNYANAVFEVLLLIGAILYITSAKKEVRLIRFVFSAIYASNILSIVSVILFFLIFKPSPFRKTFPFGLNALLVDLAFFIANSCWIYLSYRILQYFNRTKKLTVDAYESNGTTLTYLKTASLWQRYFNALIDAVTSMMLFSPVIWLLVNAFSTQTSLMGRHQAAGNGSIISPGLFVSMICYYLLFETTLSITPAKSITETRVVNHDGNQPSFKTILIRTLIRIIPFESASFFTSHGWHDSWSDTSVVKEESADKDETI